MGIAMRRGRGATAESRPGPLFWLFGAVASPGECLAFEVICGSRFCKLRQMGYINEIAKQFFCPSRLCIEESGEQEMSQQHMKARKRARRNRYEARLKERIHEAKQAAAAKKK